MCANYLYLVGILGYHITMCKQIIIDKQKRAIECSGRNQTFTDETNFKIE